ncbi:GIY-YIG nuclease family protein [Lujinxingia sediminis]|nr:GIY-YIG nuclease family protein [Lujinxingia sediminis]
MASKQPPRSPLQNVHALFLDLQTTGGSPLMAHPLELAFQHGVQGQPSSLTFELPEEASLTRHVQKMHRLDQPREHALPSALAWQTFASVLKPGSLVIAHYARFERRFIEHALPDCDARWLCTHAIARRLLPQIPRAGLTAIAGYFGHRLNAKHSAASHLEATIVVWHHLTALLHDRHGITTLEELDRWLQAPATPPAADAAASRYAIDREHRLSLPSSPGVYHFYDRADHLLYIGKATDLHSRVNSYFRTRRGLSEARKELVSQVARVETHAYATALEAALAEVDAIKHFAPPYNQALLPRDHPAQYLNQAAQTCDHLTSEFRFGPLFSLRALHEARAIWTLEEPWPTEAATLARTRFARDHRLTTHAFGPLSAWLQAGLALWPPPEPEPEPDDGERHDAFPDPTRVDTELIALLDEDAIYRRLQSCARHLSWQIRRARILSQLTDARLFWTPSAHPDMLRTIELREARITHRDTLALSTNLPSSSFPARPWLERLALLDGPTHDRLRVLATEIRRLIPDAPLLRLHTRSGVYERDALREIWTLF